MNTRTALCLLPFSLLISACAATSAPPPSDDSAILPDLTAEPLPKKGIPYPQLNEQTQIDHLSIQVARLEREVDSLHTRVQQLERQNKIKPKPKTGQRLNDAKLKSSYLAGNTAAVSDADPVSTNETRLYNQAQKYYRQGNFAAAAAVLKESDGGNGSEAARRNMYLLLQSQLRMGNCESVISIGSRYANRFRGSAQAPDALYSIGWCQYKMQQKDIARNTWRKLIQTYPDSNAAKRAAVSIKQR
ncbi:tetratricopeptide repeat protein [Neisseria perflava]|uniref:tetratricopeptide repeat protein n=1 Tax=Neisseria perflava TaxID=33053 RepID=UPI0020A04660|nr:tetratricopeptide repeat protein [Neisseria perflava]MCP1660912.1 TolA-binding protein [Neisseria perflava]MCP1771248.1 TolA-binding protein [Neisseria perflava]